MMCSKNINERTMIMKKEIPLRRFWAACLCLALMITAAGGIAYAQSNEAAVVYISDSGNDSNDGSSVQTAVKTWEKAYELVPDESKIIVAGTSTVPDSFVPLSEKTVTISGDYDETDERGTLIPSEASMTALSFGADTVMENLMPGIICKSVGDNFCILAALDLYGVSGFGLRNPIIIAVDPLDLCWIVRRTVFPAVPKVSVSA